MVYRIVSWYWTWYYHHFVRILWSISLNRTDNLLLDDLIHYCFTLLSWFWRSNLSFLLFLLGKWDFFLNRLLCWWGWNIGLSSRPEKWKRSLCRWQEWCDYCILPSIICFYSFQLHDSIPNSNKVRKLFEFVRIESLKVVRILSQKEISNGQVTNYKFPPLKPLIKFLELRFNFVEMASLYIHYFFIEKHSDDRHK